MNSQANVKTLYSFVTGILSIILFFLPLVGILLALAGIVIGVMGLKEINKTGEPGRGYALTGMICGTVGLLIPISLGILAYFFFSGSI
ncbi:hypothetical protein CR194_03830 [Salipaludibacillus keqinensis]|uniref:DUF4190 domain-containing protein n=1 Tax=Salipaludibacillus keqinensis TaxID=2045207 RepID=A0A323TJE3_9BACI|nr:DUF4190 domain-containing protein [Salipaludibacillus keqinensis]PYZ94670.1 hypothetical protein CR194_03830 [Salipaludibacillus keqinensis]